MDRKLKGRIAEAKVLAWFIENEYDVYTPFVEGAAVDLVVIKAGIVQRVSVKYTSQKENQKWKVRLTNVSRQRDGSCVERTFDSASVDLLAAYIGPEDRVVVIPAPTSKYAVAVE